MPRINGAAGGPARSGSVPLGTTATSNPLKHAAGHLLPAVRRWLWLWAMAVTLGGATAEVAAQQPGPPVLLSEVNSTRAIALESVVSLREPFALTSHLSWSTDRRTRVRLFVLNLPDSAGSDLASFTADAEDVTRRRYDFRVEHVSPVPGYPWMSGVVLRLSDDVGDVGDVLVRLTYRGLSSNRVRLGIGHVGGGPPDDVGAHPTPAPPYVISGRITSGGTGLGDVALNLSGPQAVTATTATDGTYSVTVMAPGDYTVTPSLPQDYYSFSPPGRTLRNLNRHQVADFSATLMPSVTPSHVLEFDGSPKSVDYGFYFLGGTPLGRFFWEFWAMPAENASATYLLSDGYGGAHALLFGFSSLGHSEPGRYLLSGNIFDGTGNTSFISDEGPAPREWGHFAVGWDGINVVTYYNGVPVGRKSFAGPRRTPGFNGGGGRLLIGGSDHSNLHGRIAQVRGYEGSNPRASGGGNSVFAAFAPQTVFGAGGNLLSYYFRPSPTVADLSHGHNGRKYQGAVRGTSSGILAECPGCPTPQFVIDPTAPDFSRPDNPGQPPSLVAPPAAVPDGALVFDSFSRRNSTYTLNGLGGLGSTEGGTAGVQQWRTNRDESTTTAQPFGILNGRAVLLANEASLAWVPTRSATGNLEVRVNRRLGNAGSGTNTGISFRVADVNNFCFAYTSDDAANPPAAQRLIVGCDNFGSRVDLTGDVRMPLNWTTLRVVTTSAGSVNVYADAALVFSTVSGTLATADGAGLYNNSGGMGLSNRWDNFTVYSVNPN